LIRQLFHIKQSSSVADYVEQFVQLVDQLSAYTSSTDPLYYTLRFIDGLREDIRSIVLVQRPQDLDTACVLAALQEEAGESYKRRDYKKLESGYHSKQVFKGPLPLPAPPLRDKQPTLSAVPDSRPHDAPKTSYSVDAKASALRAYRRAMGLCYECNEKWSKDHKCSPVVQLHAVQELWELFQLEDDGVDQSLAGDSSEQLFLAISKAALHGVEASRTVKFLGSIQHQPVTILVDSGSSSSFISTTLAAKLSGVLPLQDNLSVQVAGGGTLSCNSMIPQAIWFIGDLAFQSDLRVLPLTAYDVIIGMDWLECYSPMRVHWKFKWMEIPYGNQSVKLQGVVPAIPEEILVQLCIISPQATHSSTVQLLPAEIQSLIDQFGILFEEPQGLPPSRACDHAIPLIPGARPVNIRPYRYPPSMKTKIEKQIAEMLAQGLIQPSASLFSSPVLLVKKKDGTYRFYVDFRHLNALTLKSKFPVPVFDQLMDELSNASWFSCLDLRAGFHQILLKAGDEYKTAFQTHFG
jgi:hypothetical protein